MPSINKKNGSSNNTIALERPSVMVSRWMLCSATACALLLTAEVAQVQGADFSLKPSIAISQEFTDNVLESNLGKRSDYITHAQPGVALQYKAPLWDWDLGYNFDYRYYAKGSRSNETTHSGNLKGLMKLVDEKLFLELNDSYKRVSLDIARDVTQESLFVNQTDQNIATISPYILWRPGEKTTLKTGYRFSDTRYWGAGIEKREHGAFADLNHELTSRFSISVDYAFIKSETTTARFDRHDLSGGFRYNYADKSFLFGSLGNSWQNFSGGRDVSNLFWSAGITHDLGFAVATLDTRVQYSEDPLTNSTQETTYSAKLNKELKRGAIGLSSSYSEFVTMQTGTQNQRKLAFGATGRYELLQGLTTNAAATAERFSITTPSDLPYRFSGTCGLNYAFNYDITLGVNYTYVGYLTSLKNPDLAKEINRVVLEVKKTF